MKIKTILHFAILIAVVGCDSKPSADSLSELSPKQSVNLYFKCCDNGDTETLKKIIYFASGTTEAQMQKRVDALNTKSNSEVSTMLGVMGMDFKAKYEKIIDDETAEVGVICKGGLLTGNSSMQIPAYQLVLKKEDGVWKYYTNKSHYTLDELTKMIRENPNDASLYYYYGFHIRSENAAKANSFFKKYYKLAPDGFWITEDLISDIEQYEDSAKYESKMLESPLMRLRGNRSQIYLVLGQYFMEIGVLDKTRVYFNKAKDSLSSYPMPSVRTRLEVSEKELQLRKEGKYIDLLGRN